VVVLLVALVATSLLPAPASAAPTSATYRIWHWNMSGHEKHLGSTTNGIIGAILGSLRYRDPDFASMNELCHNQYRAVVAGLQDEGWPLNPSNFARFEPMIEAGNPGYCNGEAYGIALFSRFPLGVTTRYALSEDGLDKRRKLLCAHIADRPGTRFCTTHLTTQASARATQLDQVRGVLDGFHAAGHTAIIAGDFNVQPHSPLLDSWYSPEVDTPQNGNNTGAYRELDDRDPICLGWGEQTTESTPGVGACGQAGKVDLVFVAADRLTGYTMDSLPIGHVCGANRNLACSNHRIVDATAAVIVP
jgi:hypothetical protein